VRLGLIGAGRWGKRFISTIRQMEGVNLAHLASANPESAQLVPAGCKLSPDWREVTDNRELDGIILATPPALHLEMALAAIRGGIPALVEKPMALSLADAAELTEAAARQNVLVMVDHTHLFSAAYRKLKTEARAFGPLRQIRSAGTNWGPIRPDTPMLWDYAPHDIALCIDLCGEFPQSIDITEAETKKTDQGCGEHIALELRFPGGIKAAIDVSNIDRQKRRSFEAIFDRGALLYDDLATDKLVLKAAARESTVTSVTPIEIAGTLPLTTAVAEFCAAIRTGTHSHPSLKLGMEVVQILAACQAQLDIRHG